MSIHWDVNLKIECQNNEDAEKLSTYINENYRVDGGCKFNTEDFFIDDEDQDGACPVEDEVWIGYQCSTRDIGCDNVYEFFNEIKEIGNSAGVTVKNINLFFISQEGRGSFTFIQHISNKAFETFIQNELNELDGDEFDPTEEELRNEYSDKICMIFCGEEELAEYIENDEEERTCEWEFEDEIREWTKQVIEEWKFPWDEGCTMWAAFLDKDGDYLWENQ